MVLIMLSLALEAEDKEIRDFQSRQRDVGGTGLGGESGLHRSLNQLSYRKLPLHQCLHLQYVQLGPQINTHLLF